MVRNSAHDSICACSVDDVVDAVLHRYAEARAIAAGLADRAVKTFARSLSHAGPTLLNVTQRARSGVVELIVPADGPAAADVQVVSERSGLPGSMVLDADTVRTVLGMMQGPRIDDEAWIHDVLIEDTDEGFDITIAVGTEEKPDVPIVEAKQDVYTRLGARPDAVVRVGMEQPATRQTSPAPARCRGMDGPPSSRPRWRIPSRSARATPRSPSATGWHVDVDTATRTFALTAFPATAGSWTAGTSATRTTTPRRGRTRSSTRPSASPSGSTSGGGAGSRAHHDHVDWPDHVDGSSQARVGGHQVDVHTDVEVQADAATVRVVTAFVNPSGDHRLRVHLPLPEPGAPLPGRERLRGVTVG